MSLKGGLFLGFFRIKGFFDLTCVLLVDTASLQPRKEIVQEVTRG